MLFSPLYELNGMSVFSPSKKLPRMLLLGQVIYTLKSIEQFIETHAEPDIIHFLCDTSS